MHVTAAAAESGVLHTLVEKLSSELMAGMLRKQQSHSRWVGGAWAGGGSHQDQTPRPPGKQGGPASSGGPQPSWEADGMARLSQSIRLASVR